MIKGKSKFEIDFEEVLTFFPKLSFRKKKDFGWIISGELDICDQEGNYWGTFQVVIEIPFSYPFCVPNVRETSNIIHRDVEWHIDGTGLCCLDVNHNLCIQSKRGINLTHFIRNVVYPYFANQLYRKTHGEYAVGSYLHGFDGIKQYYSELGISDAGLAIDIIEGMLNNKLPGRNDSCFCGKTKFKNCHLLSVNKLKSVSKKQLEEDLMDFKKEIKKY